MFSIGKEKIQLPFYSPRFKFRLSIDPPHPNFAMNVLFLITARAGSKGIPGKNKMSLSGIPLIAFKAISARKSHFCKRLIFSSDGAELQEIAKRAGAEVLFDRPEELATDNTSSEAVLTHAMSYITEHDEQSYDAVMLLEPTSPFATHEDYDKAIELMTKKNANLVVGMREVTINSVFQGPISQEGSIGEIVEGILDLDALGRQQVPEEFTMNGAFYLIRWDFFLRTQKRYCDPANSYGIVMPPERSVEIDEPLDLKFAQFLCDRHEIDLSYWKV